MTQAMSAPVEVDLSLDSPDGYSGYYANGPSEPVEVDLGLDAPDGYSGYVGPSEGTGN